MHLLSRDVPRRAREAVAELRYFCDYGWQSGEYAMIYELRTYRIPEGRMPDILRRFETVTMNLFARHGIDVVGFWTKVDVNELVYICRFADTKAMDTAWEAFRADPEWIAVKKRSEENGKIVSEVLSQMLQPTGFSPLQ